MAIKRKSIDSDSQKPTKQSKLNFGQNMAATSAPAQAANKAANTRHKTKATPPSSLSEDSDEIGGPPKAQHGFKLTEVTGDIFHAPDGTLIIHACNCLGSWGAGIAAAFKQRYPKAFNVYKNHCKEFSPEDLINNGLLIGPMDGSPKHWVGCLFTSKAYGKKKDSPKQILEATIPAMEDLVKQIAEAGEEIKEIRICQINSGLFAVPWWKSRAALKSIELDETLKIPQDIIVYSLPSK